MLSRAGKMKVCLHCDKRPILPLIPHHRRQATKNWCPEALRVCEHLDMIEGDKADRRTR